MAESDTWIGNMGQEWRDYGRSELDMCSDGSYLFSWVLWCRPMLVVGGGGWGCGNKKCAYVT